MSVARRFEDWLKALLRRWGAPDPEIIELCAQVDALAYKRDELTKQVASLKSAMAQQRRDLRANMLAAYEPETVGWCSKVRYLREEDADQQAVRLATISVGDSFSTYRCERCLRYPVSDTRPWHVSHAERTRAGALWVEGRMLHRQCGCTHRLGTGRTVTHCSLHATD
jgi:hypothetical protein